VKRDRSETERKVSQPQTRNASRTHRRTTTYQYLITYYSWPPCGVYTLYSFSPQMAPNCTWGGSPSDLYFFWRQYPVHYCCLYT